MPVNVIDPVTPGARQSAGNAAENLQRQAELAVQARIAQMNAQIQQEQTAAQRDISAEQIKAEKEIADQRAGLEKELADIQSGNFERLNNVNLQIAQERNASQEGIVRLQVEADNQRHQERVEFEQNLAARQEQNEIALRRMEQKNLVNQLRAAVGSPEDKAEMERLESEKDALEQLQITNATQLALADGQSKLAVQSMREAAQARTQSELTVKQSAMSVTANAIRSTHRKIAEEQPGFIVQSSRKPLIGFSHAIASLSNFLGLPDVTIGNRIVSGDIPLPSINAIAYADELVPQIAAGIRGLMADDATLPQLEGAIKEYIVAGIGVEILTDGGEAGEQQTDDAVERFKTARGKLEQITSNAVIEGIAETLGGLTENVEALPGIEESLTKDERSLRQQMFASYENFLSLDRMATLGRPRTGDDMVSKIDLAVVMWAADKTPEQIQAQTGLGPKDFASLLRSLEENSDLLKGPRQLTEKGAALKADIERLTREIEDFGGSRAVEAALEAAEAGLAELDEFERALAESRAAAAAEKETE